MKHIVRFILCSLVIVLFSACKKYIGITHLSDEELEWITNRHVGEVMHFSSQHGIMDSITVTNLRIHNTPDRWDSYNTGTGYFCASGQIRFSLRGRNDKDRFYLFKEYGDDELFLGVEMLGRRAPASHLKDTCMQINGVAFDDIIFVREFPRKTIYREEQRLVPVVSLAWSKQYGLVQYSFQDGTVFNRIDLK